MGLQENATTVAFVFTLIGWEQILRDIPITDSGPFEINMIEGCGAGFSYAIDGETLERLDEDHEQISWSLKLMESYEIFDICEYILEVLPVEDMYYQYNDSLPLAFALSFGLAIIIIFALFVWYDSWVYNRQNKLLSTTNKTHAVVSSLFPKDVRNRLLGNNEDPKDQKKNTGSKQSRGDNMQAFLNDGENELQGKLSERGPPIADLFPQATIMFADLVGFTAWSSTREPTQVFTLLESIYGEFDAIARRRKVFKVETIG